MSRVRRTATMDSMTIASAPTPAAPSVFDAALPTLDYDDVADPARAHQLIAQAREERLSTIDAEAAATQARVEELERQYLERVQKEDAGEVAPPSAPSGDPIVVDPSDIAE